VEFANNALGVAIRNRSRSQKGIDIEINISCSGAHITSPTTVSTENCYACMTANPPLDYLFETRRLWATCDEFGPEALAICLALSQRR